MQRVTIKDIAVITKMSQGTVHRALYGKKGVSDEVRAQILKVANELGYTPNYVASSLKRKTLNVVVFLPNKTGRSKYFYLPIWEGIEEAAIEHKDYNINFIHLPFELRASDNTRDLEMFLEKTDLEINGLITQASLGENNERTIKECIDNNIATSFVVDDLMHPDRLCFVGADNFMTGELSAEILSMQIEKNKDILIFCGNSYTPSHSLTVEGIESYIKKNNLGYNLIKIFNGDDNIEQRVTKEILENKNLKAIYSVNAKNTVLIGELLKSLNYEKTFKVMGSDVFAESIEYMENGILDNIVHKNPKRQSYEATKILIDYIVKNETPKQKVTYSNTEIVFKSNLNSYKQL